MNGPGSSDDRDETRDHSAPRAPDPRAGSDAAGREAPVDPAETLPFAPPHLETTPLPAPGELPTTGGNEPADLPARVGPFRPVVRIATGGMGTVYEAEQDNPRRSVALKILRESAATPDVLRRFEVETRILAQLRHPGIAQIYEAGTFDHRGCELPYYAMELVEGARPIREYAQEQQLSIEEKLDLFLEVCDAVHHGHQRGVIHRDLKPANILVDRDGRAKVIDFGVARAADVDVLGTTAHTSAGQIIGTLQYMSPEQVGGDPAEIDLRTDVYSLGVVLYELLTDHFPYELSGRPIYEATRVIREESPARPSTLMSTLRGDLETIALQALEKDKERRYDNARALADDLRRYLRGEPILARPPSLFYQIQLLARRHRAAAFAAVTVMIVTVVALLATGWGLFEALDERAAAERSRITAIEAQSDADRERKAARRSAYRASLAAAHAAIRNHDIASARDHLETAPAELRGWEWHHLAARVEPPRPASIGHRAPVLEVAVAPDGKTFVSAARDGEILAWNLEDGRFLGRFDEAQHLGRCPLIFLEGHLLAPTVSGRLGLFDVATRRLLTEHFAVGPQLRTFALDASGRWFAIASGSTVAVWRLGENTARHRFELEQGLLSLAIDRGGRHLAARGDRAGLWLWDLESGTPIETPEDSPRFLTSGRVAFDPSRPELVDATDDLAITVRRVDNGAAIRRLLGHTDSVTSVAYGPQGRWLASSAEDGTVRLWRARDGSAGRVLVGHRSATSAVAFSPDGGTLISGSRDGTVRRWPIDDTDAAERTPARRLRVSPDGLWEVRQLSFGNALVIARNFPAREWRFEPPARLTSVEFARGLLALAFDDGTVRVGRPETLFDRPPIRMSAAPIERIRLFAPDASSTDAGTAPWLLASTRDGALHRLELGGEPRSLAPPGTAPTRALDIAPDGRSFVVGRVDRTVERWSFDPRLGRADREVQWTFSAPAYGIDYTHDGVHLLALFGSDLPNQRELVRWRADESTPFPHSYGLHPAWDLTPSADRRRFFLSLSDPARLLVVAPEHSVPVLTISGDVALTYHVAGALDDGRVLAYDHRGERVELRANSENAIDGAARRDAERWAAQLLTASGYAERAIERLRRANERTGWEREVAYYWIVDRGVTLAARKAELATRLLEPGPWSTPKSPAAQEALTAALNLRANAPNDPEVQRWVGVAHLRVGDVRTAVETLAPIALKDPQSMAFHALALERAGRTREARRALSRLATELQMNEEAAFALPPSVTEELRQAFAPE